MGNCQPLSRLSIPALMNEDIRESIGREFKQFVMLLPTLLYRLTFLPFFSLATLEMDNFAGPRVSWRDPWTAMAPFRVITKT